MKTPLLAAVLLPLTAVAHSWTPPPEPLAPEPAPVYRVRAPVPVGLPPAPAGQRADDVRDLWSIDATLAQLDRAAATRDVALLRWVDGRARGLLRGELGESRSEAERARLSGDRWGSRRAQAKLSRVVRLEDRYREVGWRLDPWSIAQRRAILLDLDRLNRNELAVR